MHSKIVSSSNAKFLAELSLDYLLLYREKNIIWKKPLPSKECSFIGLGNNGTLLLRSQEGIYLYSPAGEERNAPIPQYASNALKATSSFIKQEVIEERGNFLVLERITEKTSLSERIFKKLKEKKDVSKDGSNLCELLLVDLATFSEECIWYHIVHKSIPNGFLWQVSPDLSYYVVCEASQKTIPYFHISRKMFLIDRDNNRTLYQVNLADAGLQDLRVNYQGTVIMRLEDEKDRQLIVADRNGKRYFITPPDAQYEIQHLGKLFVALKIKDQNSLILKNFDDKLMYEMDLAVFEKLHEEYTIIFRPNDDIVIVGHEAGFPGLKIIYTTIDNFGIEYKRWQMTVEEEIKEKEKAALQRSEEERFLMEKERITQQKVIELAETAKTFTTAPSIPKLIETEKDLSQRANIFSQLERLKLMHVTGELPKDEYEQKKALLEQELAVLIPLLPKEALSLNPPEKIRETLQPPSLMKELMSSNVSYEADIVHTTNAIHKSDTIYKADTVHKIDAVHKTDAAHEEDLRRTQNLIEKLEERFIVGEISEKTYLDLKEKYEKKLNDLRGE